MLIWTLIWIAALLVLYGALIRSWYVWWQIGESGVPATAKVIFLKQGKGMIVRSQSISYQYDVPDLTTGGYQTFTATRGVHSAAYKRASDTSQIDIRYLSTNPSISLIVGDNFDRNFLTVIAIGFPFVALFFIMIEQTMAK